MANLTITKSGNSIIVDFGDYTSSPSIDASKESFDIRDIVEVELEKALDFVIVKMRDALGQSTWTVTWDATYSGDEYFIIDSVETVPPTSQEDLFDKLTALRN
jgi:hypothetical protein